MIDPFEGHPLEALRIFEKEIQLQGFVVESNKIEGITSWRDVEFEEAKRFLQLKTITVAELEKFVKICEPQAFLRVNIGDDVRVGDHRPPPGGPQIRERLERLLNQINAGTINAYDAHREYETLHAWIDCNGRSGRILWAYMVLRDGGDLRLGFLHAFYYQALQASQ